MNRNDAETRRKNFASSRLSGEKRKKSIELFLVIHN